MRGRNVRKLRTKVDAEDLATWPMKKASEVSSRTPNSRTSDMRVNISVGTTSAQMAQTSRKYLKAEVAALFEAGKQAKKPNENREIEMSVRPCSSCYRLG